MDGHAVDEALDVLVSCPICMTIMDTSVSNHLTPLLCIPCGHRYCSKCFFKMLSDRKDTCPVCRMKIKNVIIDHLLSEMSSFLLRHSPRLIESHMYNIPMIHLKKTTTYGITFREIPNRIGVQVMHVNPKLSAYKVGLRVGDIVVGVNFRPFSDLNHCYELMKCFASKFERCSLIICVRKLLTLGHVSNKFKHSEQGMISMNSGAYINTGDLVLSCNGKLGDDLARELMELGATVDGKQKAKCPEHLRNIEVLLYRQ